MTRESKATIGVRDVARRLNVTLKYVYDLVYSGRLAAQKDGRTWRIPVNAVETHLKKRGA